MAKQTASTALFILGVLVGMMASQPAFAEPSTVKTNHSDVNLWSEPGRWAGEPLENIKRFEEIQVLSQKKLVNGETWYRVQLRRFPDGKKKEKTGWVNSKYFTDLENPVIDDQPPESVLAAQAKCTNCPIVENPPLVAQLDDIKAVQSKLTSQPKKKSRSEFIWPVGGVLRSGFGYRSHPITGKVTLHKGMDISKNNGAKVKASKGGTIEIVKSGCRVGARSCGGGYGNMVLINHGDGTKTRYAHLSASCRLPKKGTRVSQGAIIGCVGNTGLSKGPHLHFEVIRNGKLINPLSVLPKRSKEGSRS